MAGMAINPAFVAKITWIIAEIKAPQPEQKTREQINKKRNKYFFIA
jgi:hypothetical protein